MSIQNHSNSKKFINSYFSYFFNLTEILRIFNVFEIINIRLFNKDQLYGSIGDLFAFICFIVLTVLIIYGVKMKKNYMMLLDQRV
jgi:hypothetical protein